ncbi:Histone-lysine N-methyltransferase set9 [Verticillium nonalfalfae]|uniref:Histone-lysine N-methyltransferase SET9 n=1 Tax=Verticillium nonalfalfae TaxID=1051616 RepID=A0A3M9YBQ8_9PEZI|nr:Histone-lysine N-methyltransferase set9 [Verticillium nonalfalfae]RNJ57889.1 Histone-lysine N-methyltransferase set9 [Verticillium nonalfalfae]
MPPSKALSARKQALTLTQLATYDDILTDAIVDHVFYWTTIPKNRSSYHASRGVREEEIAKIIQTDLVLNKDIDAAERNLLTTDGLRKFCNSLKTDKEKADFRGHLRRYLNLYLPDCPFEVNSTNRYTIVSHEAAITARRFIARNETVKYLSGVQVMITPEEEREMTARKKDFSIIISSRNKCASLFMGPARFANHDCKANAKLVTTGQAGIEIIATTNIDVGDEITVTYADSYFGEDNCECLCSTCERRQANGWHNEEDTTVKRSIEDHSAEGYLLRRRRRDDSVDRTSRTPSVSADIRPRVSKSRRGRKSDHNPSVNDSAAAESPLPPAAATKKRTLNTLTPPITPAKKSKLSSNNAIPAPSEPESSRSSSAGSPRSHSLSSTDHGASTDITEPERQSPERHLLKPLVVRKDDFSLLKREETDERSSTMLTQISLFSSPANITVTSESDRPLDHTPPSTRPLSIASLCNPPSPPSSQELANTTNHAISAATTEPVTDPDPVVAKLEAAPSASVELPKKRKYQKRTFVKETTPPARHRIPGDYTLTPLLLSEPETAWIRCINCDTAFVQHNAYYTKSSCPRCERHSKLYGYLWPKTEKAGPRDMEERILDHRIIHRFLHADDEAKIRGRKRPASSATTPSDGSDCVLPPRKRQRVLKDTPTDSDEDCGPVRRSGRTRRVSSRLAEL